MDEKELIKKLKKLQDNQNAELSHIEADDLLLDFIDNDEIRKAFDNIGKWYC